MRKPDLRATVPAQALIPLRLFLGATFVIAGFDKLLDPRFFDPASPGSIQAQMLAFSHELPIGALVSFGMPFAVPIGLAIAFAEIAAGLGVLTGLAFKPAAMLGAALSLLFFLTASWATRPFYYGADLPFAAGWITLALAGHGDVLIARRLVDWAAGEPPEPRRGRRARPHDATSPERRAFLQSGALAVLALVAASLAVPLRAAGIVLPGLGGVPGRSPDGTGSGDTLGSGGPPVASPASSAAPGGIRIASVNAVARTGATSFTVPFSAPAPFPAGDPGVIVRLADGSYVAFDAVCTHAGCTVEWDQTDRLLVCPCHGAAFDPADDAAVIQGPTDIPLTSIPIVIDPATGAIYLSA